MEKSRSRTRTSQPDRVKSQTREVQKVSSAAKSTKIADAGIQTSHDFTSCFAALIADIATQRMPVKEANAMCNAGGKVLGMTALEVKVNGVGKTARALPLRLVS